MNMKALLIMGLSSMFGLIGCTKAQIGKQTINLDNLNYNSIDAAYYYAEALDYNKIDLNDTTKREFTVYYKKDTLRYYNTETDELYPPLVAYLNRGGNVIREATFCGEDFKQLDMFTTEEGNLVLVNGNADMNDEGLAKLLKTAKKKYGEPHFEEREHGKSYSVWRWEEKDEYIQLRTNHNSGKSTLQIIATGDESEPVRIQNEEAHIDVTLSRWKKKYHDLVIAEDVCFLLNEEKERQDNEFHSRSAAFYTPEVIRPFLATAHYLDSLEHSAEVWGKIEASYYQRIPNGRIIDSTGVMDTVKVNQEGYLPIWSFGGLQKDFKNGMSNKAYIVRLMKKGKKLYDLMNDAELCHKICLGEAEWKNKKRFAGVIYFSEDEQGNITLPEDSKYPHSTLYGYAFTIDDNVKKELKESGLNLEKTIARAVNFPGSSDKVVYFTDGELERFMFIGDWYMETKKRIWECGKVYSVLEYLEDTLTR